MERNQSSNSSESLPFWAQGVDLLLHLIIVGVGFYILSDLITKREDAQGGIRNMHKFQGELSNPDDIKDRLDDVRGIDEIRDEIKDLIHMIKNPLEFTSKGAKLHKGVLLHGAPGTGKTLIARAIAGESGVPFLYVSGSNFDEMYVGVGAKRIREMFKKARESAPCIIFIDEIDTLLSSSRRYGAEHSSSKSTINAFLSEMDGFE
jgi:ATP-dependent Zn protease